MYDFNVSSITIFTQSNRRNDIDTTRCSCYYWRRMSIKLVSIQKHFTTFHTHRSNLPISRGQWTSRNNFPSALKTGTQSRVYEKKRQFLFFFMRKVTSFRLSRRYLALTLPHSLRWYLGAEWGHYRVPFLTGSPDLVMFVALCPPAD